MLCDLRGKPAEIRDRFENVKSSGEGWTARCPAHEDGANSLSGGRGNDGRTLVHCFAGCTTEAIVAAAGLTMRDLFPKHGREKGKVFPPPINAATVQQPGLTLQQYADAKQLPLAFLQRMGLSDITLRGQPAVRIVYAATDGSEVAVRFRHALEKSADGDARFTWRKGSKAMPYGLSRLEAIVQAGAVTICEGESDAQTLWLHDQPAIGIPGADTWNEAWAAYLDGFERVNVVIEPDQGGMTLKSRMSASCLADRVWLVNLGEHKDPSGLYLVDPAAFRERWHAALAAAIPLREELAAARETARAEAWAACESLARSPAILDVFVRDLARAGVVGEARTGKIVFLMVMTRFFERPVSGAAKGPSSAGKSWTVEQTLRFHPPSAYFALTAMSERALAYSDEPLANRMLVLYEAAGMAGDFTSYLIRSLLSEGRLRYETVEKTKDGLRARLIERQGPTGLIVTTTAVQLHPENETRLLTLPVTDTPEQTSNVMRALAAEARESPDHSAWHALQRWVEMGPRDVTMPFAATLAGMIPPVAVRLRRDFKAVLTLVRAHALLHQATRARTETGAIVATLDDYAVVRELVAEIVAEGLDASVPASVRETVTVIASLLAGEKDGAHVTVTDVARNLRIDKSAASRRVQAAEFRGYLKNLEDKKGRPARLVLADLLPIDRVILPTADALAAALGSCTVAGETGERDIPSPPHEPYQGDGELEGEGVDTTGVNAATVQPSEMAAKSGIGAECINPAAEERTDVLAEAERDSHPVVCLTGGSADCRRQSSGQSTASATTNGHHARDEWEILNERGYPRTTLPDGSVIQGQSAWLTYLAPKTARERLAAVAALAVAE